MEQDERNKKKNVWTKNREIRLKRPALIRGGTTNDGGKGRDGGVETAKRGDDDNNVDLRKNDRWDGGRGSWSI